MRWEGSRSAQSPAEAHERVNGPAVLQRLTVGQRQRFDIDWRAALQHTTQSFDVAPLKAVLRSWWLASGGDAATARLALEYAQALSRRRRPTIGDLEPACERHGPSIFLALPAWQQVEFENRWNQLCVDAISDYDLEPFEAHLTLYWNLTAALDPAFVAAEVAAAVEQPQSLTAG